MNNKNVVSFWTGVTFTAFFVSVYISFFVPPCPLCQPSVCPLPPTPLCTHDPIHIVHAKAVDSIENYHGILQCRAGGTLLVRVGNIRIGCNVQISIDSIPMECDPIGEDLLSCFLPVMSPTVPHSLTAACAHQISLYPRPLWFYDEKCDVHPDEQQNDRPSLHCPSWNGGPTHRQISPSSVQNFDYNKDIVFAINEMGNARYLSYRINFLTSALYGGWGPGKQASNVLSGLRRIGMRFEVNNMDFSSFHFNIVLDTPTSGALAPWAHQLFFKERSVKHFWITTLVDFARLRKEEDAEGAPLADPESWLDHTLVPSCRFQSRAHVAPIGVDSDFFSPVMPIQERKSVMIYVKGEAYGEERVTELERILTTEYNFTSVLIFRYGDWNYNDDTFRDALRRSKFVIIFNSGETYGIAMQEIKMADVPALYVDIEAVNFWHRRFGIIATPSSWIKHLGRFISDVEKGVFSPRSEVVDYLSTSSAAINMIRIVMFGQSYWRPNYDGTCIGPVSETKTTLL